MANNKKKPERLAGPYISIHSSVKWNNKYFNSRITGENPCKIKTVIGWPITYFGGKVPGSIIYNKWWLLYYCQSLVKYTGSDVTQGKKIEHVRYERYNLYTRLLRCLCRLYIHITWFPSIDKIVIPHSFWYLFDTIEVTHRYLKVCSFLIPFFVNLWITISIVANGMANINTQTVQKGRNFPFNW